MIAYCYNRSVSARDPQMPDSGNQRIAAIAAWEAVRRNQEHFLLRSALGRRTTRKSQPRGKRHMKAIFTGLIALCTVAATFAEEAKFGLASRLNE